MDNQVGAVQVRGKFEETTMTMNAQIAPLTNSEQRLVASDQVADDDKLIPNIGDYRVITQKGTIGAPDGETFINTELKFVRTRNKNGGVDVTCHVPYLGLSNEINP